ncbi:MAG TPA: AAA family ATPase [Candidatus Limnocylindrales bacterium]|nr:AAA family ATPase [Candidatus Limnocylindrales bacterium]
MELRRPALIGRDDEVRRIEAALARASAGRGGTLLLAGETGVGKTRLMREATELARRRGYRVLDGRAYPVEQGLAYAPLSDALGSYLRGLDARRQASLVAGLPHLGRLIGGLPTQTPETFGEPELEKTRMFEAVALLVARLAREAPVVLCLDDLHWADPASLELIHYLARGIADQRVLILAAYSPDEAGSNHGLGAFLSSAQRNALAEQVVLSRLRPPEVAALVAEMLGGEPPRRLLLDLEERAAGTPLFAELLLQGLLDTGQLRFLDGRWVVETDSAVRPPPGVQDLILRRVERLETIARRVLETIAVSGEPISESLLREAVDLDEEALVSAVDRLRTAGLADEEQVGRKVTYRVSHPMVQEVVYQSVPPGSRRRVHATLALAIERGQPTAVEALARHYRGAGPLLDPDKALRVAIGAGERARELHANEAAARHFGAALAIVREGRRTDLLPWLLERLGEAWEQIGEGSAAISVWTEATNEYERAGDAEGVGRVHRFLGMAEWDRGHFDVAQSHLSAGLTALADREPSQELADLLHARLVVAGRLGDSDAVAEAAAQLEALAAQLHSTRAAIEAGLAAEVLAMRAGANTAVRDRVLRIVASAEEAGELLLAQRAHNALALMAHGQGDHRLFRQHAQSSLDLARRVGAPTLELFPRFSLVNADVLAGEWDEAVRASSEALALARRVNVPRLMAGALTIRAIVMTYVGELAEAGVYLSEARAAYGRGNVADRNVPIGLPEVMLALERGEAAHAVRLAAAMARAPGLLSSSLFPQGLALLAEAKVAAGDPVGALATARDLLAQGGAGNPFADALGARAEGLAHAALGNTEAAGVNLARAAEGFKALDMPFELARARVDWAAAVRSREPAGAATAARGGLEVFDRLGARRHADRARALLRQLGVRPPSNRRRRGTGPLSDRELEVARLVAEGLTNAQIAERLVLSPRTVSTHLDRMYSRLGLASRAALARYVAEQEGTDRLRTRAAPVTSADG